MSFKVDAKAIKLSKLSSSYGLKGFNLMENSKTLEKEEETSLGKRVERKVIIAGSKVHGQKSMRT
jgi:hypothetical protein